MVLQYYHRRFTTVLAPLTEAFAGVDEDLNFPTNELFTAAASILLLLANKSGLFSVEFEILEKIEDALIIACLSFLFLSKGSIFGTRKTLIRVFIYSTLFEQT